MALKEMVMPKMGESVMEGTILNWLKKVGDKIEQDESVLEVATDKVDTEVPAPFAGTLKQILVEKGTVVAVGSPIAMIETSVEESQNIHTPVPASPVQSINSAPQIIEPVQVNSVIQAIKNDVNTAIQSNGSKKFFSPLVMNIARQDNISFAELEQIQGSGSAGRVTKNDVVRFLEQRKQQPTSAPVNTPLPKADNTPEPAPSINGTRSVSGAYEIIEMDRMRRMIADRMLESKRIAPHVTSFVEADVTNIVYWRNRMKNEFMEKESAALTFTPIFIEAVVKAIKDYPMMNVSIEGNNIIVKKDINIGMAVALPNGNLMYRL